MNIRHLQKSAPTAASLGRDDDVVWLASSRLRPKRRPDRLLTWLCVTTMTVLGAAAGIAAYDRGADTAPLAVVAKTPDRAMAPSVPRADLRPVAEPAATASAPMTKTVDPVRIIEPAPEPVSAPASMSASAAATPEPAAPEALPASEPEFPRTPVPSDPAVRAAMAQPMAAAAVQDPAPVESPRAPAPEPRPFREARATASDAPPPAPSTGKVSVYLDSFPDQKAAAAALKTAPAKYAAHIGGHRLTYTRRNGAWRLRVGNLDPAAADAMCAKVKAAGETCALGAN